MSFIVIFPNICIFMKFCVIKRQIEKRCKLGPFKTFFQKKKQIDDKQKNKCQKLEKCCTMYTQLYV